MTRALPFRHKHMTRKLCCADARFVFKLMLLDASEAGRRNLRPDTRLLHECAIATAATKVIATVTQTASKKVPYLRAPPGGVQFTYSNDDQPWFRRNLIRVVERASGSDHFRELYETWVAMGSVGNPFEVATRLLDLRIELAGAPLASVPREGGVLLVANHPFGIADGLALGWLASQMRGKVRILTHALLCNVPEFRPYLLPVDFGETPEARRSSATTRTIAADLLADGGAVVIFPGGSVATSNRPFTRPAAELPWHPFVGRLAVKEGVHVVPVHIHGQNSLAFQIASHLSYPLRVSLLFHETRRRIGSRLSMTVGAPLAADTFRVLPRAEIAGSLRTQCLELGGMTPNETFHWPKQIRW